MFYLFAFIYGALALYDVSSFCLLLWQVCLRCGVFYCSSSFSCLVHLLFCALLSFGSMFVGVVWLYSAWIDRSLAQHRLTLRGLQADLRDRR